MQTHSETVNHSTTHILRRFRSFRYFLVLEGIAVGLLSGIVTILFRLALEYAEPLRNRAIQFAAANPWFLPFWFLILIIFALFTTFLLNWEPFIGGSGIPQVKGELQGQLHQKWWRVLLAKFIGGILTIGAGLSLGREGPSIQLGAMAGKGLSKTARRTKTEEKFLMSCGAGAGLAAAFNAPFAGVLFTLEELHKNFSVEVLLSTMTASITADFISRNIFGLTPIFQFDIQQMMPLDHYGLVILLGLALGLLGVLYNKATDLCQTFYGKIKSRFVRVLIPFVLAGILGFVFPSVLGGGHGIVSDLSSGSLMLYTLLLLFAAKFLFSVISFGSGVPGGIFLPLLVMGAIVGSAFSSVLSGVFQLDGALLQNFIILGMAGYFSAIVRAPITGIILISEMTGSFSHLLTLSIVSLTAYLIADLLKSRPIYDQLLARLLQGIPGKRQKPSGEKILIETPVAHGCTAEHKTISQVRWPKGCLVVALQRGEEELLPEGDTTILAGDTIVVLADETVSPQVYQVIQQQCSSTQTLQADQIRKIRLKQRRH